MNAFQQNDNKAWSGALHISPEQRKEMEEKEYYIIPYLILIIYLYIIEIVKSFFVPNL